MAAEVMTLANSGGDGSVRSKYKHGSNGSSMNDVAVMVNGSSTDVVVSNCSVSIGG